MPRIITISTLIRGQATLRQLEILGRADRMFAHLFPNNTGNYGGRYFGGILTPEQVRILDTEYFQRQNSDEGSSES